MDQQLKSWNRHPSPHCLSSSNSYSSHHPKQIYSHWSFYWEKVRIQVLSCPDSWISSVQLIQPFVLIAWNASSPLTPNKYLLILQHSPLSSLCPDPPTPSLRAYHFIWYTRKKRGSGTKSGQGLNPYFLLECKLHKGTNFFLLFRAISPKIPE